MVLVFVTFLPQFGVRQDTAAPGKLFFLGGEFILVSIPFGVLTVYGAAYIARALTRSRWVQKALNWGFAGVFTTFAGVILTAQARH